MKTCTRCERELPVTAFRIDPRNGRPKPRCTECLNRQDKERFAAKSRAERDDWNARNRGLHANLSDEQRKKFTARQSSWYASLTPEQRDARNAAKRRRYAARKDSSVPE